MIKKNQIVVTGGTGRFANSLRKIKSKYNFIFPKKNELDITKSTSIKRYLKKNKPKYVLHLAGLSRPMIEHELNIQKSINLNIIGTSNMVNACANQKTKLIYFSTSYVYPGTKGNYKENSPLKPYNNYGLTKMLAESAITKILDNYIIIRTRFFDKRNIRFKTAASDIFTSMVEVEDLVKAVEEHLGVSFSEIIEGNNNE